jgi:hypothetical protein
MRTLLLSVLVLLFCVTTASAQAEMIAHWPLDGNTQEVINGLHGIPSATGVSYVTDDPQRGHVLLLDGHTGYITLPSEIWTVPEDTNTTITCWFNWAGGVDWQRVYSLGYADPAWKLIYFCPRDGWVDHNLHVTFHAFQPDKWYDYLGGWGNMDFDTITPGVWYFSAVILKDNTLKIWVNNKLVTNEDSVYVTPQKIQAGDSSINVLGKSHWAADTAYNGMIDDVRIYGDALTDEEVLALYEEGNVSVPKVKPEADINLYGLDGKIMYSNVNEKSIRTVSVYSVTGSLLFRSDRISDLQHTKFIPGVYIVRMAQDGAFISRKVVIAN